MANEGSLWQLKQTLEEVYTETGSLTHERVLAASELLDQEILAFIREHNSSE